MIELTPFHMQVAGIAVIVLAGLGLLWWIVHAVMGMHRGRPIYMLPDTHPDTHDADQDDEDDHPGGSH